MELLTVTTVLGDWRVVTRTYEDGSAECPFCRYPIAPSGLRIDHHPWCEAHPSYPPEKLRTDRERWAAEQAASERRARQWAWSAQYRRVQEASRRAVERVVRETARERGACIPCALTSLDRGGLGRVRYVRHRGECPRSRR